MKWQLVVAVAAFSLSLACQSPPNPGSTPSPAPSPTPSPAPGATTNPVPSPAPQGSGATSKDQTRIDQRAQSMREQIGSGRTVQSHVRVSVHLKNGNRLIGVVKDGMMVERVDGLRFVEAQAQERGAGIRLWYTGGTRNYVFVPFGDFADYEVLQQLSSKQLAAIEQEMQMDERRAGERAAAAAAAAAATRAALGDGQPAPSGESATNGDVPPAPAAGADASKAAPKGDDAAKAKTEQDQQRAWFTLLQDYPPSAGWSKAKRDEIARRKVVIGATPSPVELRFVEKYDEWIKACAHFGVNPEKKAEGTEEPANDDKKKGRKK